MTNISFGPAALQDVPDDMLKQLYKDIFTTDVYHIYLPASLVTEHVVFGYRRFTGLDGSSDNRFVHLSVALRFIMDILYSSVNDKNQHEHLLWRRAIVVSSPNQVLPPDFIKLR